MGCLCCKPKRTSYNQLASYKDDPFCIAEGLSDYSSKDEETMVLARKLALECVKTSHCTICLETNVADKEVYDEWMSPYLEPVQLLNAPDGVFGSLCACDPGKLLTHLACLAQQFDHMTTDTNARRTCGFCDQPWIIIQTTNPGAVVRLDLLKERVAHIPAWKWDDIPAGRHRVRVLAGTGVASTPINLDIDLPDAYETVQVEVFDQFARRIDPTKLLSRKNIAQKFSRQSVGRFITWKELRVILDDLEALV